MAGSNLKAAGRRLYTRKRFWKFLLGTKTTGKHRLARPYQARRRFLYKAGIPASNTAADSPGQIQMICIDTTNKDVYLCTFYVNDTSHTWTKISD